MPTRRLVLACVTVTYWAMYLVAVVEAVHYHERLRALEPLTIAGGVVALGLLVLTVHERRGWASEPESGDDVRLLRRVADELSAAADYEGERARRGDLPGRDNPHLSGHARGFAAGYAVFVLSDTATRLRQRALAIELDRGEAFRD